VPALKEINASIPAGKITGILGPNGSGKSTLLKAILGLISFQAGSVATLCFPLYKSSEKFAYVPQQNEVDWNFPLLVEEVVSMGRYHPGRHWKRLSDEDYHMIEKSINKFSLQHLARRPIGYLSGGEKQRVLLARAMCRNAMIIILDEPFNGVDANTEKVIKDYLQELKREMRTVIIVHHRLEDIGSFDWLILLNQGIIDQGPREEVIKNQKIALAFGVDHLY